MPSFYLRRQIHATFQDDPIAVHNIPYTGTDALIWGSDYPHEEGTYPHSRAVVTRLAQGLTDADTCPRLPPERGRSVPLQSRGALRSGRGWVLMERPAPIFNERTAGYWHAGAEGVLRIARCQSCGWYLHPPMPACPRCHGDQVRFEPVSGRGTIYSFTVNRYQWTPGMIPPYVLAEVELDEQQGLRVLCNIIATAVDAVAIGMAVTVDFDRAGEAWIPVFRP